MKSEQTTVAFIADEELVAIINDLKQRRKTKNTSQVVREALFGYYSFFANDYPNMGNSNQNQQSKESKE